MPNLAEIMRPKNLDDVLGNDAIVNAIKKQLANNTVSQSIMFTGQYGSGKTTLAKILASELNADVTELDCGSEGGVDNIRDIVESSNYSSLFSARKVFILDEVHQLAKPAQSALLKTLEDEKPSVTFILLTTDPQKILKTIKSRCVIYELEPASTEVIGQAVKRVEEKYNLRVESRKDFWSLIEQADGSLRQVYALMEKIVASADETGFVSSEVFKKIIGSSSIEVDENLPKAFLEQDLNEVMSIISSLRKNSSVNPLSTTIGTYNYLKAVYLRSNRGNKELLSELAFLISQHNVEWYSLEYLSWKYL